MAGVQAGCLPLARAWCSCQLLVGAERTLPTTPPPPRAAARFQAAFLQLGRRGGSWMRLVPGLHLFLNGLYPLQGRIQTEPLLLCEAGDL